MPVKSVVSVRPISGGQTTPVSQEVGKKTGNGQLWVSPGTSTDLIVDMLGLTRGRRLGEETEVAGRFEPVLKEILLEMGIHAYYEPLKFETGGKRDHEYVPDFVTALTVGGKLVVIETHKNVGREYKKRLKRFLNDHGENIFLIVIDSRLALNSQAQINLKPVGGDNVKYADEDWRVPEIRQEWLSVDMKSLESGNELDRRRWKELVKSALVTFIEGRADKVESVPQAEPIKAAMRKAS